MCAIQILFKSVLPDDVRNSWLFGLLWLPTRHGCSGAAIWCVQRASLLVGRWARVTPPTYCSNMLERFEVVASRSASKRSHELPTALLEVSQLFLSLERRCWGLGDDSRDLQGCSCFTRSRPEAAPELTGGARGVVLLSGPQYKSEPQRPGFFAGTGALRLNPNR